MLRFLVQAAELEENAFVQCKRLEEKVQTFINDMAIAEGPKVQPPVKENAIIEGKKLEENENPPANQACLADGTPSDDNVTEAEIILKRISIQ